jgi:hypothetical protein
MKLADEVNQKINEVKKNNYQIYHNSYTSAVQHGMQHTKDQGYEISDDEAFNKIGAGPKRPGKGETARVSLELTKDGKPQKKQLHMQVYHDGDRYESNKYIL